MDFFSDLNYLDLILGIPLVYGFVKGLRRGLVFEVASVIALIIGIWGAVKFSGFTSAWLSENLGWNFDALNIVALIITFAIIVMAVHFVAKFIDKMVDMVAMDFLNKALGGIFGFLKIALVLSIIVFFVNLLEVNLGIIPDGIRESSVVYNSITKFTDVLFSMIDIESIKEPGEKIIKQI